MTVRGTAALVTALALLVTGLALVEVRPRPAGTRASSDDPTLLAGPAAHVARVELEEGVRRLAAVRRDGAWVDDDGRPWRADTVTSVVDALADLRPVMVVDPNPERPAEYGLDTGAPLLRCVGDDGRALLALELGATNPAGTALYARRAGERAVILVGGVLRWEIEKLRRAAPGAQP